ncbi:MAG: hypothetical protein B7Z37_18715 [Verrucomicrobia bacterium 12-59-8]|nr:MAG: hypothetical protein B7Z37_18715 [Verrucomicrobia bacterium 12-59-8]
MVPVPPRVYTVFPRPVKSPCWSANEEDLLVQTPKSLHSRFNLDVRVNSEVVSIDREASHA